MLDLRFIDDPFGGDLLVVTVDVCVADSTFGTNGFRAVVDDDDGVRERDEPDHSGSWVESFCP